MQPGACRRQPRLRSLTGCLHDSAVSQGVFKTAQAHMMSSRQRRLTGCLKDSAGHRLTSRQHSLTGCLQDSAGSHDVYKTAQAHMMSSRQRILTGCLQLDSAISFLKKNDLKN
ncbi:hypothetical protein PoB_001853400 [Plakobranchus ocellatus]|uniref:BLOC-1-related complex subunit 7 n=1 Tax=Plakobranchus ocellatus TaxID=259542 RepID=A0AAV3ZCC6_9GAST|nr:hypothetical protein PoB_001853400 [Plakobranchus ocellatus]